MHTQAVRPDQRSTATAAGTARTSTGPPSSMTTAAERCRSAIWQTSTDVRTPQSPTSQAVKAGNGSHPSRRLVSDGTRVRLRVRPTPHAPWRSCTTTSHSTPPNPQPHARHQETLCHRPADARLCRHRAGRRACHPRPGARKLRPPHHARAGRRARFSAPPAGFADPRGPAWRRAASRG